MGKKYQGRVSQLIRRKVAQLLITESNDSRLTQVTITDVVVNRDTSQAKVFYSIFGSAEEREEVQIALDGAAGWLRKEMAPTLRLRNVPKLIFVYDPSMEYGGKIDAIFQKLHEEEPKNDPRPEDTTTSDAITETE